MPTKQLRSVVALAVMGCFLLSSCAAQQQTLTTHLEDAPGIPAHDEQQSPGMTLQYYPSRENPDRVTTRYDAGGMLEATCDSQTRPCTQWKFKATGFRQDRLPKGWSVAIPEGTYKLSGSDNPSIAVLKNADTQQTVAYSVNNPNGKGTWIVGNLAEAEEAASKGDGAKNAKHVAGEVAVTTGKVVLYTLLIAAVVGIVVILAAGAFAQGYNQAYEAQRPVVVEQPSSPTVTRCNPNYAGGFNCFSY
jgi:hypothetical protein